MQKHSRAGHVKISLKEGEKVATLCIEDNGRGFNADEESKGNGLINMNTRATKNNGSFKIV